jgi:hypothetical protein
VGAWGGVYICMSYISESGGGGQIFKEWMGMDAAAWEGFNLR